MVSKRAGFHPCVESVTVYFPYPTDDPYKEGFGFPGNESEYAIRLQRFFDETCTDKRWDDIDAKAAGVYGEEGVGVTIPLSSIPKGKTLNGTIDVLKAMYDAPVPPNARKIEVYHQDGDRAYSYYYAELTPEEVEEERIAYEG